MGYGEHMPLYRTQVSINTADNIAANFATNTMHVFAPDLVELALWHSALVTFYQSIDIHFSNLVRASDGVTMKSYDLSDPEPRAPVLTFDGNLTVGGSPLPTEVSLVMSFQAPRSSGINQARRRNRIYIPFISQASMGTDGRPSAACVSAIVTAGGDLLAASGPTSADWQWMVYSPSDDDYDLVDNGWVDNEFDTQRRRGRQATSRSTF